MFFIDLSGVRRQVDGVAVLIHIYERIGIVLVADILLIYDRAVLKSDLIDVL